MAKKEKFEYRHINNIRNFLKSDLLKRYKISELNVIVDGIRNDTQLNEIEKRDLTNYISNYLTSKYENTRYTYMNKEELENLKNQVKNNGMLKVSDKQKILKTIRRHSNDYARNENIKVKEERKKQINTNEKQVKGYEKQVSGFGILVKDNEKQGDDKENKPIFIEKVKENNRENSSNTKVNKKHISLESLPEVNLTKKKKAEIEAQYLSGKDFRNYSFEEWTIEEKQINEQISKIRKKLEKNMDRDKAFQMQLELMKYKLQMNICLKYGKKALDKEILKEEIQKNKEQQNKVEKINIEEILENWKAHKIEEKNITHNIVQSVEKNQQLSIQDDSEVYDEIMKAIKEKLLEQEANSKVSINSIILKESEDEKQAKIDAELKRKAEIAEKISASVKAKIEAEEKLKKEAEEIVRNEEETEKNKKRIWTKIKDKVSNTFKRIVGPVLAALTLGTTAPSMINAPKLNDIDNNPKNINETVENGGKSFKETNNNLVNIFSDDYGFVGKDTFKDKLKVEGLANQNMTLGDIVYIEEGCNYFENSLKGGNHNIVDGQNQWRPAGNYMIDGLAVTYQNNNGEWTIAKLKDDNSCGGNYGNIGLESNEYVNSVLKNNGLSKEQIKIMYHINQGLDQGEHPTGWIEAPDEGLKLVIKYQNTINNNEKTKENNEIEK
ncbi:MAG TPA: hypothetical protein PK993_02240 [Clostridia bacterium]|nr:hypothetical protein [Clostridia bacterium]